jgi:hypothetical protein
MLQDELTHILSEDRELSHLILVDTIGTYGLARKLRAQNRPFLTADLAQIPNLVKKYDTTPFSRVPTTRTRIGEAVRRFLHSRSTSDVVVANVLKIELHASVELLKREVYRNIERMCSFSDGILVLYGLCDSLKDLERDFAGCRCPLYFLTDESGTKVEDCIALALGGNDSRWQTSRIHSDIALFLTPMWASSWQNTCKNLGNDLELAQSVEKLLLEFARFNKKKLKVAKVDTGLRYEPNFDENVHDFARLQKMGVIQLSGNTDIVERCYLRAKSRMHERMPTFGTTGGSTREETVKNASNSPAPSQHNALLK